MGLRSSLYIAILLCVVACSLEEFQQQVTFDTNTPQVLIATPVDGFETELSFPIKGTCIPDVAMTLSGDNLVIPPTTCGSSGFFSTTATATKAGYWTKITVDQGDEQLSIKVIPRDLSNRYQHNTLVVYNENVPAALEIAQHYATKRSLPTNRLCGVKTVPGIYIGKSQLLGIRNHIIDNCICPIADPSGAQNCSKDNLETLANLSPISHLALVKIPIRLLGTGWPSDGEHPAMGVYLSHLIYKDPSELFGEGLKGWEPTPKYESSWAVGYQRPLSPARHRMVAWGHIEGLSTSSAKKILDKTLSAENTGLTGNVFFNLRKSVRTQPGRDDLGNAIRSFLGDSPNSCIPYLEDITPWPADQCRAGATQNGKIPAGVSTIPLAINASIYLGADPFPNGQAAFDGKLSRMLKWRKSAEPCTPLCKDLPLAEQEDCRLNSTDFFKEINTTCVGVADGMVGHQVRSYPVTFYGVFPNGWGVEGGGPRHRSAPTRLSGASFQNTRFRDPYYIRLGGIAGENAITCQKETGEESCLERAPVNLVTTKVLDEPILFEDADELEFNIRARYRTGAGNGRKLCFRFFFKDESGRNVRTPDNSADYRITKCINTEDSPSQWKELAWEGASPSTNFIPHQNSNGTRLEKVTVVVYSSLSTAPQIFVDLDGIELNRIDKTQELISADEGSFNLPYTSERLAAGAYAANAMDRLGAVAWWGSSSHHLTGGWAFSSSRNFFRNFSSGKSLGEAIYSAGSAPSGIIYGDPAYSPLSVALSIGDGSQRTYAESSDPRLENIDGLKVKPSLLGREVFISMNAIHGRNGNPVWKISRCFGNTFSDCIWTDITAGQGEALNRPLDIDAASLELDAQGADGVWLRLEVKKTANDQKPVYSYIKLRKLEESAPSPPGGEAPGSKKECDRFRVNPDKCREDGDKPGMDPP